MSVKNNKTPLISVIVPVFNVEKYLERCVDSILNQSYKDLEIILVDDGSTDRSGEICEGYAKKDSRVRVFHKKNGGLSDARNFGISKSRGEYVGFVDSDDWIDREMFSELKRLAVKYDADIVTCNIARASNEKSAVRQPRQKTIVYSQEDYVKKYFKIHSQTTEYYACNKLYKSSILTKSQYPYGLTAEDVLGTYLAILKAYKIVATNQTYYYYFKNPASITVDTSDKIFDQVLIWDKVVDYTKKYAPQYNDYVEVNRKRVPLNILYRCASNEKLKDLQNNKKLSNLLIELKSNERELLKAPICFSRKAMIFLCCRNFFIFSCLVKIGRGRNA